MVIYQDMNGEIHLFNTDLVDGQGDSDPLLEIAAAIVLSG